MRYRVTKGIFEGRVFKGELSSNGKTVWDLDTVGRGYPVENTEILMELQAEALKEQGLTADTSLEIFCKQKAYALKQQLKKLEAKTC